MTDSNKIKILSSELSVSDAIAFPLDPLLAVRVVSFQYNGYTRNCYVDYGYNGFDEACSDSRMDVINKAKNLVSGYKLDGNDFEIVIDEY